MNALTAPPEADAFDGLADGADVDFSQISPATARRALRIAVTAMLLCARGNGATAATMKALVLHLRSPDVGILTNSDAIEIIDHLELRNA